MDISYLILLNNDSKPVNECVSPRVANNLLISLFDLIFGVHVMYGDWLKQFKMVFRRPQNNDRAIAKNKWLSVVDNGAFFGINFNTYESTLGAGLKQDRDTLNPLVMVK